MTKYAVSNGLPSSLQQTYPLLSYSFPNNNFCYICLIFNCFKYFATLSINGKVLKVLLFLGFLVTVSLLYLTLVSEIVIVYSSKLIASHFNPNISPRLKP